MMKQAKTKIKIMEGPKIKILQFQQEKLYLTTGVAMGLCEKAHEMGNNHQQRVSNCQETTKKVFLLHVDPTMNELGFEVQEDPSYSPAFFVCLVHLKMLCEVVDFLQTKPKVRHGLQNKN